MAVADKFIRGLNMNFLHFFLFFILSLVAVLPVIYGRRGGSSDQLDRLALFQGVLGLLSLVGSVAMLLLAGSTRSILVTVIYGVAALLGFMMVWVMVSRFILHRNDANKAKATRNRMHHYQGPLGVVGIALCAGWLALGL